MPAWFVLLARVVRGSKGGGDEYAVRTDCMGGGFWFFLLFVACLFVCLFVAVVVVVVDRAFRLSL